MSVSHPITNKEGAFHINMRTGEHIYPTTDPKINDLNGHSVAIVEIDPKGSTSMHYHPKPFEESYTFFPGSESKEEVVGEISLNGKVSELKTGDTVVINSEVKHQFKNTTDKVVEFVVICSPPWNPECSIDC